MNEPQELSLVAATLDDDPTGLIPCQAAPKGHLVPAVILYGANASGKSNILHAFGWMRHAVLYSHSRNEPGDRIKRDPFALEPENGARPSAYDMDFMVDGCRYHYGFEVTDDAFISEWLYVIPQKRRQMLFERAGQTFTFGRNLKGRHQIIAGLTRPNSLFLSAAAQNGHEDLSAIRKFFERTSQLSDHSIGGNVLPLWFRAEGMKLDPRTIDFLGTIGTGIIGHRFAEAPLSEWLSKMLTKDGWTSDGLPDLGDETINIIELAHQATPGQTVFLDLNSESLGTKRLLALLPAALRALDHGTLLVVDELSASLHTQACEAVLALFARHETNPKGAQLMTTTHDTNLLRSPFLRRDQIWFTEKDHGGATHLYPLTDFHSRKGDNLEKGYLQGRYGAIPFAGALPPPLNRQTG